MKRALWIGLLLMVPATALAQNKSFVRPGPGPNPSAERIKSAAEEYDAGRRAFNDGKFDEAAIHFENAFHDAPAAAAIRNAVTARQKAGHGARAATEAALAQTKYPDDAQTQAVVKSVLGEFEPKLQKVILTCTPECGVVADGRAVSLEDSTRVVFYLDPGDHEVSAGWTEDRTKSVRVTAKAGGKTELSLEAPPVPVKKPPTTNDNGPQTTTPTTVDQGEQPSRKPFGPAIFIIGTVLTAGGIAATIGSGIDTINNPGTDKVKMACVGKGEQCPEYQQGVSSQLRTNLILGATIGVGVLTGIVGLFLTQWSSPTKTAKIRPILEIGSTSQIGLQASF